MLAHRVAMPVAEQESVHRKLSRAVGRAITDFAMIEDGDRILVAVSGGKDSYTMLHLLRELREQGAGALRAARRQHRPGAPRLSGVDRLASYMAREGHDFRDGRRGHLLDRQGEDPRGQDLLLALLAPSPRHPLSRRARARLQRIALGHHRDDVLQTLLLNLFFAGQLAAMPPKLVADEGRLRRDPTARLLRRGGHRARSPRREAFPILPCDLCGSQDNLQRKVVGRDDRRVGAAPSGHEGRHARRAAERAAEPPARPAPVVGARAVGRAGRERDLNPNAGV